MIYLDWGATSFQKPRQVKEAMAYALRCCSSVGRGGYLYADNASRVVYGCRETAGRLLDADPEQVVFTMNCTHGLNIAINSLAGAGDRVAVSGFEHNAVMRPLYALGAKPVVFGRTLFHWDNTLTEFEKVLRSGVKAAVFTQVSNVFGYILPVEEMSALCRRYGVAFAVDAAQGAGNQPVRFRKWGADFVAMPGHKGLLGPQGTGLLLCSGRTKPLLYGGTGTASREKTMPETLPERLEAGTMNVMGIAGLEAGMAYVLRQTPAAIAGHETRLCRRLEEGLAEMGYRVFRGNHQSGTLSVTGRKDPAILAARLGELGVAVRAGLHCAPLAHESAGTLPTGTLRFSTGPFTTETDIERTLFLMKKLAGS